jgi:hypothetical protein
MSELASCEVCGFVWDELTADEIAPRLHAAVTSLTDALVSGSERISRRPGPTRWSVLEYSSHVRDVLLAIRERIVLAVVTDDGVGTPIYRDERVNYGVYSADTVDDVTLELRVAERLLLKTFASMHVGDLTRTIIYSPMMPWSATVLWMGAQAVHEAEHHLADVRDNLR